MFPRSRQLATLESTIRNVRFQAIGLPRHPPSLPKIRWPKQLVSETLPRNELYCSAENQHMRALILLLAPCLALGGELKTLELTYKEGKAADYAAQVEAGFKKLLVSDSKLAAEFQKFESPPPENARGRYSGDPKVQVLTLAESEHVDFRDSGGSSQFGKTIALYFRFDEGMHRGSEFHSGFFALFEIKGELSYRHVKGDDFELSDSKVVAAFKGFSRTLTAPAPTE